MYGILRLEKKLQKIAEESGDASDPGSRTA